MVVKNYARFITNPLNLLSEVTKPFLAWASQPIEQTDSYLNARVRAKSLLQDASTRGTIRLTKYGYQWYSPSGNIAVNLKTGRRFIV